MEWMNEAPKTVGWYWLKGRYSRNIIVEIFREKGSLLYDDGIETHSAEDAIENGYSFGGPIPDPED